MFGAIAGDVIGSVYERLPTKRIDFELFDRYSSFTDDTVLTIAVAQAIMKKADYATLLKCYARKYPDAGYGYSFYQWMSSDVAGPYNSWGNGSAMRVAPVGIAFDSIKKVLDEAKRSAEATHNHPEGIKGAQATALSIFMARTGESKDKIRDEISVRFSYDLSRTLDDIRPVYSFDVSCQRSVPESVIAFLESSSFEDAIRKAISLGGDSDTMACIAGGIAQAFYKEIPAYIIDGVRKRLPDEFLAVIDEFSRTYGY
jgi:ADP-ribosylglycohydrolase